MSAWLRSALGGARRTLTRQIRAFAADRPSAWYSIIEPAPRRDAPLTTALDPFETAFAMVFWTCSLHVAVLVSKPGGTFVASGFELAVFC
jgi:hypothetical protein